MKVRILYTDGMGEFLEGIYDKPQPADDEIVVESVMTGVCRSDAAMAMGQFPLLPMHMMGHEGLGIVAKTGSNINQENIRVGDFVATRGEPAFADLYNCKVGNFVKVKELNPKYILEPVACGFNLIYTCWSEIMNRSGSNRRCLIIGSGFLAHIAYQTIKYLSIEFKTVDVVGKSNSELFPTQISKPNGKYDVVIDISENPDYLAEDIYTESGLLILAAPKYPDVGTDLSNLLWNNMTIKMPSPRSERFLSCMQEANRLMRDNKINVDKFWTKAYNRDTEWQQAFKDAIDRPPNYNRGYITWQQ